MTEDGKSSDSRKIPIDGTDEPVDEAAEQAAPSGDEASPAAEPSFAATPARADMSSKTAEKPIPATKKMTARPRSPRANANANESAKQTAATRALSMILSIPAILCERLGRASMTNVRVHS